MWVDLKYSESVLVRIMHINIIGKAVLFRPGVAQRVPGI